MSEDSSRFSYPRFLQSVSARTGAAFEIRTGERFQVLDQEGRQACAIVALRKEDHGEWLSPAHTRAALGSIMLTVGATLVSNRREPLLRLEEDTVGRHDLLMPACDRRSYLEAYGVPEHSNCRDNLAGALAEFDIPDDRVPDPVNLFMHVGILGRGELDVRTPLSEGNDYVVFRALTDLIVAVSACPQDRNATNGFNPTGLLVRIFFAD